MTEKVLSLVSGGIDSPVASILASKEFKVIPLHFTLYPMTSKKSSLEILQSLKELKEKMSSKKAIVFPWAGILSEIVERVKDRYSCVVCRRCMFHATSEICRIENAMGIVTGESLGQKASQTIENISSTSIGIPFPIIRPVIGMDKDEIVKLSRKWDLQKTANSDSCPAIPPNPLTKAQVPKVKREVEKIHIHKYIEKHRELISELKDIQLEEYISKLENAFQS